LELFKEKEEQEIIKKEFDPESGIELKIEPADLNKIQSKKSAFKETHKEVKESQFSRLEHGVLDEEVPGLDLDDILQEEFSEATTIQKEFEEELIGLINN